jgi:hypothetical protein
MPTIEITRDDGTRFIGVSNSSIDQEGGGGAGALIVMPGVGWTLLDGKNVKVRGQHSQCGASGSRLFMQTFAAASGEPTTSRFTLIESGGDGYVSRLDGSDKHALPVGYYIDTVNSDPPVISEAQEYVAAELPDTANALAAAEDALQAEEPES